MLNINDTTTAGGISYGKMCDGYNTIIEVQFWLRIVIVYDMITTVIYRCLFIYNIKKRIIY